MTPRLRWKRLRLVRPLVIAWALWVGVTGARAHNLTGDPNHPHYDYAVKPPETIRVWPMAQIENAMSVARRAVAQTVSSPVSAAVKRPAQAEAFALFSPRVSLHWDETWLYIESNGLPAHGMMTGITAWQQQVPLPQPYTGTNAWQLPLQPVPSNTPVSIRGRFLRGAIAIAVNGIPIFNPQNNRGELSQEIGELDQWGGHCGRADDYHYHAAPFHLQSVVGPGMPIAYALDGYAIYGLTEPDGSTPQNLDPFNGHTTAALGYHYHGSTRYPYVNGGFHGVVVEREGQVDPQPRAQPIRPALPPLRGARITGFNATLDARTFSLRYTVNGQAATVKYGSAGDGVWKFQFVGQDGTKRDETYRATDRANGGGGAGGERKGKGGKQKSAALEGAPKGIEAQRMVAAAAPVTQSRAKPEGSAFMLRSPAVKEDGVLPVDFTGDGASASPPLEWSGVPGGTKSYALIMHHLDPEG
ncbi:MAG: YHYH protein, partial [Verrucomicrobiota bacterium]